MRATQLPLASSCARSRERSLFSRAAPLYTSKQREEEEKLKTLQATKSSKGRGSSLAFSPLLVVEQLIASLPERCTDCTLVVNNLIELSTMIVDVKQSLGCPTA